MFFTYCRSFKKNTGNKNAFLANGQPSFTHNSMSSSLVFDYVKNKFYFPSLGDSNSFGTVHYDGPINTNKDCFIKYVF